MATSTQKHVKQIILEFYIGFKPVNDFLRDCDLDPFYVPQKATITLKTNKRITEKYIERLKEIFIESYKKCSGEKLELIIDKVYQVY